MTPATLFSWRTRLGLNKTEAAKALGLSRNGYDYYETGRYRIPLHVALACAAIAHGLPPIQ
jgi:DNA-binding XRE family transcriptional regulator